MDDHDLLKLDDVLDQVNVGKTTIYDWIKKGIFPAPTKINGTRSVFWTRGQIRAWKEKNFSTGQISA